MLIELGIDPDLSVAEIKKVLEKKKQGILRKLNAVFGNPAKEQELNKELERVEELIIQLGLRQVMEDTRAHDERSALLSNVKGPGAIRLNDFQVQTRELSQTRVEIAPQPAMNLEIYQQALDKAIMCLKKRDMDGAYGAVCNLDARKQPALYAVLGLVYQAEDSAHYDLEKAFCAFRDGAELGSEACVMLLAKCYYYGRGTDVNHECAIKWLEIASQTEEDAEPEQMLGELYGKLGKFEEMFNWYQLGLYEHDSWQCRIDLAEAILKYKLGNYYTDKALELLNYETQKAAETGNKKRSTLAYRVLLHHYTELASLNTKYRKKVLEVTTALVEECGLPCASTLASMHRSGYAGKADYAKAVTYYQRAEANGETFDQTDYEKTVRIKKREEKLSHVEDRVFTAADAEALVNKTRKERSDVLRIPEGYTKIANSAFQAYAGKGMFKKAFFSEVVLPQSLLAVGASAFFDLKGFKRYNLPPNIMQIGFWAFRSEGAGADHMTIPGDVQKLEGECFKWGIFGTVKIAEGVEILGEEAFGFTSIKRLELPSSLKQIATNAGKETFHCATIGSLRAPRTLKAQIEAQGMKLDPRNITYYD